MTFHGHQKMDIETWKHMHEAPAIVVAPLIILAIPSVILGAFLIEPMLFGKYFDDAIYVASIDGHDVLAQMGEGYTGIGGFLLHSVQHPLVLILMFSGVFVAWLCYIKFPDIPGKVVSKIGPAHKLLVNKYGFDDFNQLIFAKGSIRLGHLLWRIGDINIIDGFFVNGTARSVRLFSSFIRHVQSGYLYHYAFSIIIGLLLLLVIFVHGVLD
jgi:NADH-quinone oxidoreductase subunit L